MSQPAGMSCHHGGVEGRNQVTDEQRRGCGCHQFGHLKPQGIRCMINLDLCLQQGCWPSHQQVTKKKKADDICIGVFFHQTNAAS